MNYKKIYNQIIDNRKQNPLNENEYGEWHHIKPRSLGGSDDENNLVRLSAREHFICHALLAEMYEYGTNEWYKMNHAFMMMKASTENHIRYMNSKLYEAKRKDFSKVMSKLNLGENNPMYGKTLTTEEKKKISLGTRKALGIGINELTYKEKKELKRQKKRKKYTTKDGTFVNSQRRNTIKRIFDIDLSENFNKKYLELKEILYNLYVVEKKSTVEISKIYNTNDETIRNYLDYFDIERRSLSEALKNYSEK